MRLLWSSRSPFVRKTMVAVHELGLAEALTLERVVVAASKPNDAVMRINPLNRIPTLILDDGTTIFESLAIIEYLNGVAGGDLVPGAGAARWPVLRLHALGDGLCALGVLRLAERGRGEQALHDYVEAYARKSRATLDRLESEAGGFAAVDAGTIAVAVGLSYLDFRFADDRWREGRPALAAWHETFARRPSMRATVPEDVY